jgi:hypothetical protein
MIFFQQSPDLFTLLNKLGFVGGLFYASAHGGHFTGIVKNIYLSRCNINFCPRNCCFSGDLVDNSLIYS